MLKQVSNKQDLDLIIGVLLVIICIPMVGFINILGALFLLVGLMYLSER